MQQNPLKNEHSQKRGESPAYGSDHDHAIANAKGWLEEILQVVARLNDRGSDLIAVEAEISESILALSVRDGWYPPGIENASGPEEYNILLTTGGPGLRLIGHLNEHREPDEWPRLEYQDWGVEWTEYLPARECRGALRTFARQFYYGD